jgi:hypothetical protein
MGSACVGDLYREEDLFGVGMVWIGLLAAGVYGV